MLEVLRFPNRQVRNEKHIGSGRNIFDNNCAITQLKILIVGIDVINKVVERFSEKETSTDWSSVLVEVTTSEIKTIDCVVSS